MYVWRVPLQQELCLYGWRHWSEIKRWSAGTIFWWYGLQYFQTAAEIITSKGGLMPPFTMATSLPCRLERIKITNPGILGDVQLNFPFSPVGRLLPAAFFIWFSCINLPVMGNTNNVHTKRGRQPHKRSLHPLTEQGHQRSWPCSFLLRCEAPVMHPVASAAFRTHLLIRHSI